MSVPLELPAECIPGDHARQMTGYSLARRVLRDRRPGGPVLHVLDLGCGKGNSVDFFRREAPGARWLGIDVEDSPEVRSRTRGDAEFRAYDGIHIPAGDASIDVVFCNQVMTYVRYPAELLAEVRRVLTPGGHFVGSASQMEPFLPYTYWNFTPYGFHALLKSAGLRLAEIRPSIDAVTLLLRRLLWKPRIFDRYWENESPLNRLIGAAGRLRKRSAAEVNTRKLLVCGQFCFHARPAGGARPDAPTTP